MDEGFRWQDEYVFSPPFTYEVVDKAEGSVADRLKTGNDESLEQTPNRSAIWGLLSFACVLGVEYIGQ